MTINLQNNTNVMVNYDQSQMLDNCIPFTFDIPPSAVPGLLIITAISTNSSY